MLQDKLISCHKKLEMKIKSYMGIMMLLVVGVGLVVGRGSMVNRSVVDRSRGVVGSGLMVGGGRGRVVGCGLMVSWESYPCFFHCNFF